MDIHYFLINYGNGSDYYRLGLEGDVDDVERELQKHSRDVKYISSKKKSNQDSGNRELSKTVHIRSCKFAFTMKTVTSTPGFSKSILPVDNRHLVLEGAYE